MKALVSTNALVVGSVFAAAAAVFVLSAPPDRRNEDRLANAVVYSLNVEPTLKMLTKAAVLKAAMTDDAYRQVKPSLVNSYIDSLKRNVRTLCAEDGPRTRSGRSVTLDLLCVSVSPVAGAPYKLSVTMYMTNDGSKLGGLHIHRLTENL
ncbi:hypothetical protein [Azospirillum sp. sgz302134]